MRPFPRSFFDKFPRQRPSQDSKLIPPIKTNLPNNRIMIHTNQTRWNTEGSILRAGLVRTCHRFPPMPRNNEKFKMTELRRPWRWLPLLQLRRRRQTRKAVQRWEHRRANGTSGIWNLSNGEWNTGIAMCRCAIAKETDRSWDSGSSAKGKRLFGWI